MARGEGRGDPRGLANSGVRGKTAISHLLGANAVLDHIGFPVRDFVRARAFYMKVLAPLGYGLVKEVTAEMSRTTLSVTSRPAWTWGVISMLTPTSRYWN